MTTIYAIRDKKTKMIFSTYNTKNEADRAFDEKLDKRPWASDFIEVAKIEY